MKLVFTENAINSLQECLDFFPHEMPPEKINAIRDRIIAKADTLLTNPYLGQKEEHLEHLGINHRRVIEGNYKIIYKIDNETIIITDIFESARPRKDESVNLSFCYL